MTQQTPAETPLAGPNSVNKQQISSEDIVESLKNVGDDLEQILKLTSEEQLLVTQFLASLKHMPPQMFSIPIPTSVLPIGNGAVTQAHIASTGHLILTFEDGHQRLIDLSETKNRDLMMAAIGDILPKFKTLTSQIASEKLQTPPQVQEPPQIQEVIAPPALIAVEPLPTINIETPVGLPDSAPTEVPEEAPEMPEMPTAPVLPAEEKPNIAEITAETLEYLEMIGGEVFEYSPVSRYFDDWMVNLRQIILSFESNELIGPDEAFTQEYNQIFGDIEDELAKRLADEADIEVSARTLVENRYLLNKIDEGYAAQTQELVVKGKDAIDYLTRNVQQLEAELAEVAQIKTSYRHPLQKMAKDQKQSELTQKLNAAKKRLALAVGNSSVDQGKAGDIDAEYAVQTQELADKRIRHTDAVSRWFDIARSNPGRQTGGRTFAEWANRFRQSEGRCRLCH